MRKQFKCTAAWAGRIKLYNGCGAGCALGNTKRAQLIAAQPDLNYLIRRNGDNYENPEARALARLRCSIDTEITTPETWSYDQSTLHRDQYDLMPVTGTAHTVGELAESANVFTSEEGEHVVAISYETVAEDVTVTYEIYLLADGFTSPIDGQLVAQGTQTHKYKGFYIDTRQSQALRVRSQRQVKALKCPHAFGRHRAGAVSTSLRWRPGKREATLCLVLTNFR